MLGAIKSTRVELYILELHIFLVCGASNIFFIFLFPFFKWCRYNVIVDKIPYYGHVITMLVINITAMISTLWYSHIINCTSSFNKLKFFWVKNSMLSGSFTLFINKLSWKWEAFRLWSWGRLLDTSNQALYHLYQRVNSINLSWRTN